MPRITLFLILLLAVLAIQVSAQEPPANQITFDAPLLGELGGAQEQLWTFEGEIEQSVVISAERFPRNPDSLLDPMLELYDPNGNLIASDDNSSVGKDAILLHVTLPMTGQYVIRVSNMDQWNGGSYQLTLARSNLPTGCQTPQGSMIESEMPSVINRFPVTYRIFLPPCHDVLSVRYPYVILMHGSSSGDGHWDLLGADEALVRGMALNRLPPMALVLPFGGELANTNVFRLDYSWEYVVTEEMLPYMESTYCLQNTRDGRAIGGISRGGFWAFEIAFRHPDLFATLGGHSPFFDWYHAPETHNPLHLSQATPPDPALRIWMDRGKNDYAQVNIDAQHENMTQNGIEHTFMLYDVGRHENAYWSAHAETYLQFYGQMWTYDAKDLPLCE